MMAVNSGGSLRDQRYIEDITKGRTLDNPSDIEAIFKELQSDGYNFESPEGRDFDDEIYELHQKVLSGEIVEKPQGKVKKAKGTKKSKGAESKKAAVSSRDSSSSSKAKSNSKSDDEAIKLLVELELKKREKRRKLIIILASIVAIGSLGYFGGYYYISNKTSAQYEKLSDLKGNDVLASLVDDEAEKKKFTLHKQAVVIPDILEEYKTLYAKNKEFAGWLSIDGTKIDYPVMQTTDNDFYLKHNFNKEPDNNGSLFLDCDCSLYPQSTNMIVYGHHMKSGNMFGFLQKYAKESYWKEHPTISFDTIYEKGTYEVMYVFYSKVYGNDDLVFKYYQFINANSAKEFEYYMNEMQSLSLYDTGVTASYGDTLLTLSTCDHSQTDGRFAVVAKRVR